MTDNSSSAQTSRSQGPASKIKTFKGQQSKALGAVTAAATGRRGFLLTGAALGAGALLGRAVPGEDKLLRSPGSPAVGPTNADWATLRAKLSTRALSRPGDSSYPLDHQLFDPRSDYLRPARIAYCGTPGDVSTCLAFVRSRTRPDGQRHRRCIRLPLKISAPALGSVCTPVVKVVAEAVMCQPAADPVASLTVNC
jgi:hypothetical protein